MTEAEPQPGYDISLLAMGTTLLRNRSSIARWMLIGSTLAVVFVSVKPALYSASASFLTQGTDADRAGLASIAGQFGVRLPIANQSIPPELYVKLLQSRVLLIQTVRDTLVVPELGGVRKTFLDLFNVRPGDSVIRQEEGVKRLRRIVKASLSKATGVVELSVVTKWPSVSVSIANSLITGINDFNLRTRQGQAAAERRFVENRLALAAADLRSAEDQLESFLRENRQYSGSPVLTFQRERLQRDLSFKQQVFTSLTQSYEEVRLREVRDTPVITVIEAPTLPVRPEPRWLVQALLFGLVVGGMFGGTIALIADILRRRRSKGDSEVEAFVTTLEEVKGGSTAFLNRIRQVLRRSQP
jgi:uncharacterized protein involved in exopolysaccharide biosynthesis